MADAEPRDFVEYKTDHDLLIELRVVVTEIRKDIKALTEGTHGQLTDHEDRIRRLERQSSRFIDKQGLIGGTIGIAAAIAAALIRSGKLF